MRTTSSFSVADRTFQFDYFTGIVDENRQRTQTGIQGGSFANEKHASSTISTVHTKLQDVWLTGKDGSQAALSLRNNDIQVREGNTVSIARVEGHDYWVINHTTNTKYRISEKPNQLFLKRPGLRLWLLAVLIGVVQFFLVPAMFIKPLKSFMNGGGLEKLLGLAVVFVAPFLWLLLPYFNMKRADKRDENFNQQFDASLSKAIQRF